jgi:hypothetical protein
MASMYREVVLKEKPAVAENGFIPLGALGKANGNAANAVKPEVAEPVAGDQFGLRLSGFGIQLKPNGPPAGGPIYFAFIRR